MAVAIDMQHRTSDMLSLHDEAHLEPLNLQLVLSRRVSLDLRPSYPWAARFA